MENANDNFNNQQFAAATVASLLQLNEYYDKIEENRSDNDDEDSDSSSDNGSKIKGKLFQDQKTQMHEKKRMMKSALKLGKDNARANKGARNNPELSDNAEEYEFPSPTLDK